MTTTKVKAPTKDGEFHERTYTCDTCDRAETYGWTMYLGRPHEDPTVKVALGSPPEG